MSSCLKFCSCKMCKRGRKGAGFMIRKVVRKFRHDAKLALRQGKEPDRLISVPYTD